MKGREAAGREEGLRWEAKEEKGGIRVDDALLILFWGLWGRFSIVCILGKSRCVILMHLRIDILLLRDT